MHVNEQSCVRPHISGVKRIYVVDDEQLIARTLCLILGIFGYEASMFFDAESAWEAIQQSAPDMVLSDVVMTGEMNGVDLAERLAVTHPRIKVMLISGQGMSSDALKRARERGFSPEIRMKPVAPRELLTSIEALLGSREQKLVRSSWPLSSNVLTTAAQVAAF